MDALVWFIVWAFLIFLMMRFGCGAHVMGHARSHGESRETLKWVAPKSDTDLVCGKTVNTSAAKPSVFDGSVYYFCSRECREIFEAAPHLYAGERAAPEHRVMEKENG